MPAQLVLTAAYGVAFEAASCMWVELAMFVAAAAAYTMVGGNGFVMPQKSTQNKLPTAVTTDVKKSRQSKGRDRSPGAARGLEQQTDSNQCDGSLGNPLQAVITEIRTQGRKGNLGGAVAAYEKLQASGSSLSPQVHNCLIDAHIQCNDIKGALKRFKDIANAGNADVVTYNIVLKALLGLGRTADVQELLREMAERGLPASRVTFHELLNAEVVAGNRRGMWRVVDDMRAAGHAPDSVTCSILAKSLKDGAYPWDIKSLMSLVAEIGGSVDEVLLSSVVEACIRVQRLDLLSDLMHRFESQGTAWNLTAPGYGSLIKAYGQAGDVTRMWELYREMGQRGVKATAITLGCMVDALVKNGIVEEALNLVHEVHDDEETRPMVNTVIYSTILKGFSQVRQIDRALVVYSEMAERGIPCNTITYNTLIDACARCGAMERVSALLDAMRKAGVEPDLVTYSTLIKGYSLARDVSRGFKVLQQMQAGGQFKPDEIMYNSLLDGCVREHRVDEGLRLLEEMQAAGITPSNYTLSTLVKLLGHGRRLDQAFEMVNELSTRHGVRLNVQVYTCLIQACLNDRRLDRAMAAYDAMDAEPGCRPDQMVYSVLVRGCLQANALDEAARIVRRAYQLPAHGVAADKLVHSRSVPGVDDGMLAESLMRLRASGAAHREAASNLATDLKAMRGVDVEAVKCTKGRVPARGGPRGRRV